MRQNSNDVSEVVDLPLVIQAELDEILRRRDVVNLSYDGESSADVGLSSDEEGQGNDTATAKVTESDHERAKNDLVGLAFSGGGIRSASFNLGMFQALHRAGFVRHADYLSTVSGGGYIGSHIASLVLGNDVKMDRCNFPLAPKERGDQPDRVIDFIRGGRYLVRQPLVFARWYFTGVLLNNLVLLSGLFAVAMLIAMVWRSMDTWPIYGLLRSLTAGWSADWNRPFFVAGFALLIWMTVKAYQNWRSQGQRDGGAATTCLLVFYGSLAIALGVLLGNGDIGGLNWTGHHSKNVWVPLLSILGVMLLPLMRPWRLLHSGTRPASKAEGAIFKLTSYALLAGVPLALIAYLAHENISGFSNTRTELAERDIHDWRMLTELTIPVDREDAYAPTTLLHGFLTSDVGVKTFPSKGESLATFLGASHPAGATDDASAGTPTTLLPQAAPDDPDLSSLGAATDASEPTTSATPASEPTASETTQSVVASSALPPNEIPIADAADSQAVSTTSDGATSDGATSDGATSDGATSDGAVAIGAAANASATAAVAAMSGTSSSPTLIGAPINPVSAGAIRAHLFPGDTATAATFFEGLLRHVNQTVITNEDFAKAAAATVDDAFWDNLEAKEQSWLKEVNDHPYRRDLPVDYADYQILSVEQKAELAEWSRKLEGGASFDATKLALFNRLYLEAAYPEFITNRNRILRSIVAVPDQIWRLKWFCISLAIFVIGMILVDPNITSIHTYYSRQLSRAYIEPVDGMGRQIPMCRLDTVSKGAPYLLVNATVNLYGRRDASIEPRDVFVFSRKFCGSPSTRFCPSSQYLGGSFDLANGMAISGGAVTTSSVGNPLVAVMMFVLNFRLGQWLPNPREQSAFGRPALWQVVVDLFRETRNHSFCFISDGGHCENLGAKSLLERKCKVIVISDAGQDGAHVFADFVKLYRNLRTRRGIQFFDLETGGPVRLAKLMLTDPAIEEARRGKLAQEHFVPMGIRYEDGSVGLLIYVKPSFTGDEEVDLASFRASNPEFPHQPTSDQVYDEIQFESYRQLGYHIGSELCRDDETLWRVNANERIDELARVLARTDWRQIERAARKRHDDTESYDRPAAAEPTVALAPAGDVPSLLDQFRTGEPQLRILALKELASLKEGGEAALPELINDLRQAAKSDSLPLAADRAQLAWAIGTFGPAARAAASSLVTLLQDSSPEVRAACAEALGEIGVTTQSARKALTKATRDKVEKVRDAADRARALLGRKASTTAE